MGKKLTDELGHEVNLESLQQMADFTSHLYIFLVKKMVANWGDEGRQAVSEAIREFGRFRGKKIREKVDAAGLEPNMENEYKFHDLPIGTKIWEAEKVDSRGDANITRVTRCPFGQVWKALGEEELGRLYCDMDIAIWEGYNKDITYQLNKCIFSGCDYCEHQYSNAKS